MKKTFIIVTAIALIALVHHAQSFAQRPNQPDKIDIKTVNTQYLKALQSGNYGLIESALFEVIKLQLYAPDYNFDKLAKAVEKVIDKTKSPELQYKAYIASQFLRHTEWLTSMQNPDELRNISRAFSNKEEDILFAKLADELQNRYLVLADNEKN